MAVASSSRSISCYSVNLSLRSVDLALGICHVLSNVDKPSVSVESALKVLNEEMLELWIRVVRWLFTLLSMALQYNECWCGVLVWLYSADLACDVLSLLITVLNLAFISLEQLACMTARVRVSSLQC